jgi:ligand-binding SRPBCC domain-containing protein
MTWVTEIAHANEPHFFVDEQRKGPYKLWHHQHHFRDLGNGQTEMRDVLYYEVPLGFLGSMMNSLFISGKIDEIFQYREKRLNDLFKR